MLTRFAARRQPIFLVRLWSDKVGDVDSNKVLPEVEKQDDNSKTASATSASTQKIQELLKSMVEANKAREENNNTQFSTAPGIFKKRKQKFNVIEVKEEKIVSLRCKLTIYIFPKLNHDEWPTKLPTGATEESVAAAATEVAEALGGDVKQTEAELLSRVLGKVTPSPTNLSDLVLGMKIDRSKEPEDGFGAESRGQQVRRLVERSRPPRTPHAHRREPISVTEASVIDIFNEAPLGILKPTSAPNYGTRLETWERLKQRELGLATAQPPANYFQKMIKWTEQGKVWKFPLDNEQGLEEEAKVHFSEHVFLESHLEGWCPRRGPVRHFMELVCVGLSKNPFYTVQEKRDHIQWFRDYFESKKEILAEVGALDNPAPKPETTA